MAFLIEDELKTVATAEIINKITADDDEIVSIIIDESIALMSSYLSKYYDVETIFSQTGTDRNNNVLKRLKDISIYEIYERHTREQNKVAMRRWEEAMKWLEKLNTGEFEDKTLPPLIPDEDEDTATSSDDVRFGSNEKYSTYY